MAQVLDRQADLEQDSLCPARARLNGPRSNPPAEALHRIVVVGGGAAGLELDDEGREVTSPRSVGYDTLAIAIGSIINDFGTPGVAEYAVPLETADQAERFNRRVVNACIRAQTQEEPVRCGQLNIAIVGAGATGTELARA
jgi:NADH dehydrogenase FAD-containing subunit